ncbi:endonuclease III [bacterium DOLZORAL124_64_63]|nr:MAG: endonuclease III [bacterium DOLZORAL124_64_63]
MVSSNPTPKKLKTLPTRRKRAKAVIAALREEFPDTKCSLIHQDAWQLLVATVLSAQCTDARVNMVTPELFRLFPTPQHFIDAPIEEIEATIRSTGFYRNKAKSLKGAATRIMAEHDGQVPDQMAQLVKVPGVGRKTANVVLGEIWNKPDGVVVDTHVGRISRKLGLTDQKDPVKVEKQLSRLMPQSEYRDFGHLLIDHGRKTCRARAPKCDACNLYRWCETRA